MPHLGPDALALEQALAAAASVHLLPDGLVADHAVAMIGTGRTAMNILEIAAPGLGDPALVTAAGGGIGTLLVQALRSAGAIVIGLAGGEPKASLARQFGAAAGVDYSQPGWAEQAREALAGRLASLVLDGVGSEVGRMVMGLLARVACSPGRPRGARFLEIPEPSASSDQPHCQS